MKYSHYEVWEQGTEGNLKIDNIWTLDEDTPTQVKLSEIFRITKQDVVLEIGAYNGRSTVRLSEIAKWVLAVEGDPDNYNDLVKNTLCRPNVVAYNMMAGKENGERILYSGKKTEAKSFYKESLNTVTDQKKVNVVKLDDYFYRVDYVTLEVNLAELDVLMGIEQLLTNNKIRLISAGWYKLGNKPAAVKIKKYLEGLGYTVYIGKINRVYAYN